VKVGVGASYARNVGDGSGYCGTENEEGVLDLVTSNGYSPKTEKMGALLEKVIGPLEMQREQPAQRSCCLHSEPD
jgi:hypothetical protein